jgi:hypothetical protein
VFECGQLCLTINECEQQYAQVAINVDNSMYKYGRVPKNMK